MRTLDTDLCIRSMTIMASGNLADLTDVVHPQATNREAKAEPPPCRGQGPAAFAATAHWLRAAFTDLTFDVHDTVADGNLIAVHCTMSGRHTGAFVAYDEHGEVAQAFPPTGHTFTITQTHWFRMQDGLVIEHWANRDDLGMAAQLRWVPPTPAYLWRMAKAKRQARRTPTLLEPAQG
ncbi:ester cyclase [Paractinoplanes atraurantiacus]|uniref:SnoaL-like polyketide cyclase n=1 Tax=Paractinoplanes atraurantiacus TaxID=1036182 RepID=A0A285K1K1_9ACTN|nr:ester cyclase [Actinoplanes atraurantiacus]SNY65211.1 SnoaL-like polyketide cyclase [Actinoplanes atraurantiacus]